MSSDTREIIELVERLPDAKRGEVTAFVRSLLEREQIVGSTLAASKWLSAARGSAKTGVTTDHIMSETRGES